MKMKYYLRGFGIGILFVTLLFSLLKKPDVMTEEEIREAAGKLGMVTAQEAEEKRLAAIREAELKWKDEQSDEAKPAQEGTEKEGEDGTEDTVRGNGSTGGAHGEDGTDTTTDDEGNTGGTEAGKNEIPEIGSEAPPEDGKAPEDGKKESGDEAADKEKGDEGSGGDGGPVNGGESENGADPGNEADGKSEPETVIVLEISKGMSSEGVSKELEAAGLVDSAGAFNQYLIANGRQTKLIVGTYEIPAGSDYGTITDMITRR